MKKRKLLLVSANRHASPYPVYPIGISYLHSYLESRLPDYDIRLFDFNLNSLEDFTGFLKQFSPDYTGLSFRNIDDVDSYHKISFIKDYKLIADTVRTAVDTKLIIGGSAFSIYPEKLFGYFNPDFGIIGEGEESLLRLLNSLDAGTSPDEIEGLVYQKNGTITINLHKEYLKSLDLCFDHNLLGYYWDKSGMINVQTKRGCPYECIYCTYPLIEGRKVRTLDPEKIVASLKDLYFKKEINYVFFTDSVFNISNPFNVELANAMIRADLKISWGAYFSPHNLDKEHLELYKRAGLSHIEFGTESLSDKTLKAYGKHFTVDEVVRISELCNEVDIYFAHFMIIGGYGETEDTVNESFENSKRIENTVFFPYVGMRIYPRTRLQELAIREGIIDENDDLLEPVYYIAPGIRYDTLKARADATGRRWVFSDEDVDTAMKRMRTRKRKGSLWHHLKK
jgi:radical SAM superfamily enzyme YgiQ (UPF0313 family)